MAGVELVKFVQARFVATAEWEQVSQIADTLLAHLSTDEATQRIEAVNLPGRSSVEVQEAFLDYIGEIGFESEKKGLFDDDGLSIRPDYFLRLEHTGILLEVERGKTTINNMDLLDFWKCHLCPHADYLFILVPRALRQNERMTPRNEFQTVRRRFAPFFREQNHTNVRGLCLFGY